MIKTRGRRRRRTRSHENRNGSSGNTQRSWTTHRVAVDSAAGPRSTDSKRSATRRSPSRAGAGGVVPTNMVSPTARPNAMLARHRAGIIRSPVAASRRKTATDSHDRNRERRGETGIRDVGRVLAEAGAGRSRGERGAIDSTLRPSLRPRPPTVQGPPPTTARRRVMQRHRQQLA